VRDLELKARIAQVHERSRMTYGAPRIWAELRDEGIRVGRKRVARLMREEGLRGKHHPRRVLSRDQEDVPPAPDRVGRCFRPPVPDRIWGADITYVPTVQGFLHLSVVMDLYSRMVVGWAIAPHLRTELVVDALDMAIGRRRPTSGLIHHSDRGPQYTSLVFGRRLEEAGIVPSMGRPGTPADNAVIESFFDTLKLELLEGLVYPSYASASSAIFEWIEVFYNRQRRHSTLGYLSPAEFERRAAPLVV
jgi:putative transposase